MADVIYFLNKSLKEITFLINGIIDIDCGEIQNILYNRLNSNIRSCYLENNFVYPYKFNIRVNNNRFDYRYYVCIYVMEDHDNIDWDFVIKTIGNYFNCKHIKQ